MIKLSTSHFWVIAIAIFSSCGSYQKLLKSNDLDYKFDEAVKFFDDEEFGGSKSGSMRRRSTRRRSSKRVRRSKVCCPTVQRSGVT